MKIINKTENPQQIFFVDGSSLYVTVGGSYTGNKTQFFPHELERQRKFFLITEEEVTVEQKEKGFETTPEFN